MARWHRSPFSDPILRTAGLACWAITYAAARHLIGTHAPYRSGGAAVYALSALCFLAGCVGAALLLSGRHLFDEVAVGERWRRRPATPVPVPTLEPRDIGRGTAR